MSGNWRLPDTSQSDPYLCVSYASGARGEHTGGAGSGAAPREHDLSEKKQTFAVRTLVASSFAFMYCGMPFPILQLL